MRSILQWLSARSVSGAVYLFLWFFAAAGLLLSVYYAPSTTECGKGAQFTLSCLPRHSINIWLFLTATVSHQALIYYDVHRMDHGGPDDFYRKYDFGWRYSPLELSLRFVIFCVLLFGLGKLSSVLVPLANFLWKSSSLFSEYMGEPVRLLSAQDELFVTGSVCFFILLITWNLLDFAAFFRKRANIERHDKPLLFAKMVGSLLFIILSGSGLIFWYVVWEHVRATEGGARSLDFAPVVEASKYMYYGYFLAFLGCCVVFFDNEFCSQRIISGWFVKLREYLEGDPIT